MEEEARPLEILGVLFLLLLFIGTIYLLVTAIMDYSKPDVIIIRNTFEDSYRSQDCFMNGQRINCSEME